MEKDTIITLDDNTIYALLDETEVDNIKYFFAVKLDNKNNPTNEFEIFNSVEEDGETYMDTIDDDDFKQAILVDFTNKYIKEVESMIEESE